MSGPLLLDTGGWLYALAGEPPYAEALQAARPAIVPGLVLAEVDWHLRRRRPEMHKLLDELAGGHYVYESPSTDDLARAWAIDKKFSDIELGLVDASIAALAERLNVYNILTIDSDFVTLRLGKRWRQAFDLAVAVA